ncbi:MAG: DNA translocase FtsK [Candidatus Theseobacter exili]|nr:DNA translocase FtsK [Candidatus Theseobacter exili]
MGLKKGLLTARSVEKKSSLQEILGIFLIGFAVVLFLSFISYDPMDIPFHTTSPVVPSRNYFGPFGGWVAFSFFMGFGLGSYIVPIILIGWGIRCFFPFSIEKIKQRCIVSVLLVFCSSFLIEIQSWLIFTSIQSDLGLGGVGLGGIVGKIVVRSFLVKLTGIEGSILLLSVVTIAGFLYLTQLKVSTIAFSIASIFKKVVVFVKFLADKISQGRVKGVKEVKEFGVNRSFRKKKSSKLTAAEQESLFPDFEYDQPEEALSVPSFESENKTEKTKKRKESPKNISGSDKDIVPSSISSRNYKLPLLELLDVSKAASSVDVKEDIQRNAVILKGTLDDFGVDVEVVGVTRGPTITRYELQPAPGVKVQRIVSLSDDIALSLKAHSIRIVAPIPGKAAVGVEVPNSKFTMVTLRDLLATPAFLNSRKMIPLALGKNVAGKDIFSDLAEMPHLLIAGTTGSGKSVCIKSIIITMLFKMSPQDLRFLMIDPKMVELSIFNDLPHLITPVITDSRKAATGLSWVVGEMEKRYKRLAAAGVRNISDFNKKIKNEEDEEETLPYIVVVVDELADLMSVASVDTENCIARLAALARAVGIHLILATQRPSVDVITGVIKANFPARISFQVSSKVDSRTVLDANGADKLLGKGDMLFLPPGTSKLIRAQATFVSDGEIRKVLKHITDQQPVDEKKEEKDVFQKYTEEQADNKANGDELLQDAIKVISQTSQASVSILQRRLRIGYSRAARIMDILEEKGVVGPYNGSKGREILIETISSQDDGFI